MYKFFLPGYFNIRDLVNMKVSVCHAKFGDCLINQTNTGVKCMQDLLIYLIIYLTFCCFSIYNMFKTNVFCKVYVTFGSIIMVLQIHFKFNKHKCQICCRIMLHLCRSVIVLLSHETISYLIANIRNVVAAVCKANEWTLKKNIFEVDVADIEES